MQCVNLTDDELWQATSGNVPAQGGSKKYSLTDLKLIKRHDTRSPNHNIKYTSLVTMPWLCTPLAYAPGFSAGSALNLWRFGTGAHVLDHSRAARSFLLRRKCNLGFSPLNTRCGTFFWLALYWFRLF